MTSRCSTTETTQSHLARPLFTEREHPCHFSKKEKMNRGLAVELQQKFDNINKMSIEIN
jgi:hypothetical protein